MQTLHIAALAGFLSFAGCAQFRSSDTVLDPRGTHPTPVGAPAIRTNRTESSFVRAASAPRIYDVRDLTFRPTPKPAPKLTLGRSGEPDFGDIFEAEEGSPVVADLDGLIEIVQERLGDGYEVTPLGDGHIVVKRAGR